MRLESSLTFYLGVRKDGPERLLEPEAEPQKFARQLGSVSEIGLMMVPSELARA